MPDCYLIAVSHGSALDEYTNNWSLFTLTEHIKLTPQKPIPEGAKVSLPLEVHVFWLFSEEEFGQEFEWRMVFEGCNGERHWDEVFATRAQKRRHRVRIRGTPILAHGDLKLKVEWRRMHEQDEWTRCPAFWPFVVEEGTLTESESSQEQSAEGG